ncbi:MAG TPA: hypothetical protein DDZ22_19025, partial [Massilia sp.]|nr:hypothetical protein [Massilia sp.]
MVRKSGHRFDYRQRCASSHRGKLHTLRNPDTVRYNCRPASPSPEDFPPMPLSFSLRAGVLACLFALSACTLGPDFRRPESAPALASFATAGAAVSSHTVEQALDASWWKLFQDPLLVELEREAIDANLDLQAAAARVAQSRAALQVSGAALLPSVDAGASYARQRASGKGTNALSGATDQHAFSLSQA